MFGWLLIFVAAPFYALYSLITGKRIPDLLQRFGFFDVSYCWLYSKRIWFHAASVGEVQAAKALASALQRVGTEADIIITTVTKQGQIAAKRQFEHTALCLYAPIDLPWIVNRFIQKLRPSVYVCLETELWPNILRLMRTRNTPTLLLNGRLSKKSFCRYQKISGLIGQVMRCFNAASVISASDRERYLALGIAPNTIEVNGNAKYDITLESLFSQHDALSGLTGHTLREAAVKYYREMFGLKQKDTVLVAGSTHAGEEAMMLSAFAALQKSIPDLYLIIAPRHLDRLEQIMSDWQSQGLSFQTFSQLQQEKRATHLILVDRMGELAKLYAFATYVFCGGSLVNRGGHNIMEAAIWGKPPLYGPYMSDYIDARTLLEDHAAGYTVTDVDTMVETILFFHLNPDDYQSASQRALAVASAQQGSASRQVEMLCQTLGNENHLSRLPVSSVGLDLISPQMSIH